MALPPDPPEGIAVPSQVATYQLDDATTVTFEIEPADGFRPAGPGQIAGRVREAVGPAVEAAKEVLDKVKELRPDEVEVTFGIKVSGGAQWLVAKAVGEASFEIKLTWSPGPDSHDGAAAVPAAISHSGRDDDGSAEPAKE
jgi:hypothetical protein